MRILPSFTFSILFVLFFSTFCFSETITHQGTFGGAELTRPNGIKVHQGIIYVVDRTDNVVEMYNALTKAHLGTFGAGNLTNPVDIAFHGNTIYVTNSSANTVSTFNFNTKAFTGSFSDGMLMNPHGIAVINNILYICDNTNNRVARFDLSGTYMDNFGSVELNSCTFLALHNGIIYIGANFYVQMYDLNSGPPHTSLGSFPALGPSRGIAVGGGYIWRSLINDGFEYFDIETMTSQGV